MKLIKGIAAKLRSTSAVTSLLSNFDFGSGAQAAIFSIKADENASCPRLIINIAGGPTDKTLDSRGWLPRVNIRVEGDKLASEDTLEELAWEVTKALDNKDLSVTGAATAWSFADAPQQMSYGDDWPAYLVAVNVRITE